MLKNRSQQFLKQNTKACNEIANEYFFSLLQNRGLKVYSIKFNWKKKVDLLQYFCSFASISVWAFESRSFFQSFFFSRCSNQQLHIICLEGSTNQAYSCCNFFRIAWKLMEWPCFLQNHSLSFLQCHSSLKNWLRTSKIKYKRFGQKF